MDATTLLTTLLLYYYIDRRHKLLTSHTHTYNDGKATDIEDHVAVNKQYH